MLFCDSQLCVLIAVAKSEMVFIFAQLKNKMLYLHSIFHAKHGLNFHFIPSSNF